MAVRSLTAALSLVLVANANAQFTNWESPHVHPLDLTPDGTRLLAVNTADNRLEIFDVTAGGLTAAGAVPVGLDPVSVRARTNTEAWVVNHISDSVSVVDLTTRQVIATLRTGDEPADVIFAGDPERAFVSISQLNEIRVYDPGDLTVPPTTIPLAGEDPRALATDGTFVYAAIFDSGNGTTILDSDLVSSGLNPYVGNPNPPPNAGAGFDPPLAPGLPLAPVGGLIVRKVGSQWVDENAGDWSSAVGWDLHDHDIAVIDAISFGISYVTCLMTTDMAIGTAPNGNIAIVGLDATNDLRFEPNINGTFIRMTGAIVAGGAIAAIGDLNPHLDYTTPTVPQNVRDLSIGDPRGVAWDSASTRLYVTGMGSNNVIVSDASDFSRIDQVDVGEGPTGIIRDAGQNRLYVLNKFEGSISVLEESTLTESQRVTYFDPTPPEITNGRPFLYDTHRTSGLGQASCASCHIDGRMDHLAWDLGDPSGALKPFNQVCNFGVGGCEDWHPMKGPMVTQTLQGILETGPLHWRADRENLAAFNGAFESLLGDDVQLTPSEMDAFEDFIGTLKYPPNPFRLLDGSLPNTALANGGNPANGDVLFRTAAIDGGAVTCVTCHAMPTGTNGQLTSGNVMNSPQSMKIAQLRNIYEKTGFSKSSSTNDRGFGFTHDGSIESIFEFLRIPVFVFPPGPTGDQQRRDIEAFLFTFGTDTPAAVGQQATIGGPLDQTALRNELVALAAAGVIDVVARGTLNGEPRGFEMIAVGLFGSDRQGETWPTAALDAFATAATPFTYTAVPVGSGTRIGRDRDADGFFDQDEIDVCSDPADPKSTPDNTPGCNACVADIALSDGLVNFDDLSLLLGLWGPCPDPCSADIALDDGLVNFDDLSLLLGLSVPAPEPTHNAITG